VAAKAAIDSLGAGAATWRLLLDATDLPSNLGGAGTYSDFYILSTPSITSNNFFYVFGQPIGFYKSTMETAIIPFESESDAGAFLPAETGVEEPPRALKDGQETTGTLQC
jgi:hypothetical protein